MKNLIALLLSMLMVACGGGSSGDSNDNNGGGGGGGLTLAEEAQQILDGCLGDPVLTLRGILETIRAFPGSAPPPLVIDDPNGNQIPFSADPAGSPIAGLTGVFTFENAAGVAFMPFTAQQLQMDINNLMAGMAGLPDGTRVIITVDPIPAQGLEAAQMSQVMAGGVPTEVGGMLRQTTGTCTVSINFAGETVLSFLGIFPNLDAALDITSGADQIQGTMFFNGTNFAVVEVSLNGVGPFQFQVDLDSGTVFPAS